MIEDTSRSVVFRIEPARSLHVDLAVAELLEAARRDRGRDIRICLHQSSADPVQEMLIAHSRAVYHPPHRHPGRVERVRVISGRGVAVGFDDRGRVTGTIPMSADSLRAIRFEPRSFHAIIPLSDNFITHETVDGPFIAGVSTQCAPWAPARDNSEGGIAFTRRLLDLLRAGKFGSMVGLAMEAGE